jgi:hypothetical protein
MKLFEVIPDRFFSLLASPNRSLYAEAVLLLYDEYQKNRFGIQYDVMRDLFEELIETWAEQGIHYEEEQSVLLPEEGQADLNLYRVQSSALLRLLRDQKWILIEERENLRQYIVLPHYSSRILAVLKDLCEARTVEYQRFAFSTYQLLTGEEARVRPCEALLAAEKMTSQFIDELSLLLNNMKHHMEQVVNKTSIQDVLDHHFDEYKTKIVERSYHRLKTSDHVARYRSKILDQVQKWLLDKDLLQKTIADGMRSELFSSEEEAERTIRDALHKIEEVYRDLDEMFRQIDMRHNQYLRASYDRARYLTQHSQGIDQQLIEILEWASKRMEREESVPLSPELFRLLSLEHLTEQSLLTPRTKRAPHRPDEHVVVPVPEELRQKLREEDLQRMRNAITREKVRDYVLGRLGDREEMGMEELAPTTVEEFLYLTFTYLYGYDGTAGFRLVRGDGNRILQIGRYRFYDRKIVRTQKGGNRFVSKR